LTHFSRIHAVKTARARAIYEGWHASVEREVSAGVTPWHTLVSRHLTTSDLENRVVLEIGCGRGELVQSLIGGAAGPRHLVAADFAQSAVHFGRRRLQTATRHRVSWAVASVEDIPVADATFDTVISCETIEHVVDPVRALEEIHRVLRPGGRLVLTTPNYLGPMGLYRGYLRLRGRRYTEGGQPVCHLTSLPRTLTWMRRARLTVHVVDAIGHYLPWPGRPPLSHPSLDSVKPLRWFALHSLVVAEKR
jgi:2-polyprenyl-3-methyl-5-hydroxy-6-metoxy-1,4-benzoquinol methylase